MSDTTEPPVVGGSGAPEHRRLRLDVAYDGSGFHGFAENAGVRTVAGEMRGAIERVLREPVELTCAGRTDTGVHAHGQVVSLDVGAPVEPVRLRDAVNAMLGPEIVVRGVVEVPVEFDARFSARWRRYRYRVLDDEVPDPFLATTSWWVGGALDVEAMNAAAVALVGEHDFSSFCRRPRPPAEVSLVRRVHVAHWSRASGAPATAAPLTFEIAASAFCHQMVRSIVGALVAVGRGRRPVESVGALLAARDRSGAPNLAPPQGLFLWEVGFEPWVTGTGPDPYLPLR